MSGSRNSVRQTVLSMTSIPPRFQNLPARFAAIERQTHRPDRVQLNLPRQYRRFPGERPNLPPLPGWVEVCECDHDFGPATKLLPSAERWRGTQTDLLVCDDDRSHDKHWIERLVSCNRPADIVCERGWNIEERFGLMQSTPALPRAVAEPNGGRTFIYRLARAGSLGLYHPPRKIYSSPGYVDVFEGFLGALIPIEAISPEAFTIPGVLWTVDDVWISGMAAAVGTKVWVHDKPRPVFSDGAIDRTHSLRSYVEQGVGREEADRIGVEYLRKHYQVWK
jgi:hypothetical protein